MNDLVFSPRGTVFYVATSRGLFMKGTLSGKTLATFWAPRGWSDFNEVQISPDGRDLVAVALQRGNRPPYEVKGRLLVWDVRSKRLKAILKTSDGGGMAFSPNGHWLAKGDYLGYEAKMRLIDARNWKTSKMLPLKGQKPPWHLAFSADSRRVVGTAFYGDAGIADLSVWDTHSGQLLSYSDDDIAGGPVYFLPSSSHGKRLVANDIVFSPTNSPHPMEAYPPVESESQIKARTQAKQEKPIFGINDKAARNIAFPYRGNLFVAKTWIQLDGKKSVGGYEQLELWDVVRKKRMARWPVLLYSVGKNNRSQTCICSPDGHWLAIWPGPRDEVTFYTIKPSR